MLSMVLIGKVLLIYSFLLQTSDSIEVKSFLKMQILNSGFHR